MHERQMSKQNSTGCTFGGDCPPCPPNPAPPPAPKPIKLPPVKPVPFTATVATPKGRK